MKGDLYFTEALYWSQGLSVVLNINSTPEGSITDGGIIGVISEQIGMILVTGALGARIALTDSLTVPVEIIVQYGFPFSTLVIECGISVGIIYYRVW